MNILIVEDQKEIVLSMVMLFDDHNLSVAHSVEEAQVLLNIKKYDWIILDYYLVKSNGLELLATIPKSQRNSVIFLTADEMALHQAKSMGALTFDKMNPMSNIMDLIIPKPK